MIWALGSLFCLFLGLALGWLIRGGQGAAREAALERDLTSERQRATEREQWLAESQKKLSDALKATSQDALLQSNQAFLQLADQRLKVGLDPVRTALVSVDQKIQQLEQVRAGAYEKLEHQVKNLNEGQTKLRDETARLVTALRTPSTRGKWGETQLRRVVELAGMTEHCDFTVQTTVETDDGALRPDLIVHLPGNKRIVVDAKAPLLAFLEALEAKDDVSRKACLDAHAGHVRTHIQMLGRKAYQQYFQPTPDFVVVFLPGESFFSGALESDPSLVDAALQNKVVLTSPTTLIALLRTVAFVWQQQSLAEGAQEIQKLGAELHASLRVMMSHWNKVGGQLDKLVRVYNETSGSLEQRVLTKARKFEGLGAVAAGSELDAPRSVDRTARLIPEPVEDLFKAASQGPVS